MKKKLRNCYLLLLSVLPLMGHSQIRDSLGIVAKGAQVKMLDNSFKFTEGPVADKNGDVYFTDQPNNKIYKWTAATGNISLFTDKAGRSNGLYFDKKGKLHACADENNQLWSFDEKGNPTVLVKDFDGKLLNGPNDLWIDAQGGIYFTDPLFARNYWQRDPAMQQDGEFVYYLSSDQKLKRVKANVKKPNGIIGTPDGKKLYVADIGGAKIYSYDISENGDIGNQQLFTDMVADGMTIDNQGNIYLAGKGITVFNKSGKQIAHIPIDKGWTANVCFGGKKRDTLFITAGEAVFSLQMNVKGVK